MCEVIMKDIISKNWFDELYINEGISVIKGYDEEFFISSDEEKDEVVEFYLKNHVINCVKLCKDRVSFNTSRVVSKNQEKYAFVLNDARLKLGYKSNFSLKVKAFKKFYFDRMNYLYNRSEEVIRIVVGSDSSKVIKMYDKVLLEIFSNKYDIRFIKDYIMSLTNDCKLEIKYRDIYWFPLEPNRTRGYDKMPYITGLKKEIEFDNLLLPVITKIVNSYNEEYNKYNSLQYKLDLF